MKSLIVMLSLINGLRLIIYHLFGNTKKFLLMKAISLIVNHKAQLFMIVEAILE